MVRASLLLACVIYAVIFVASSGDPIWKVFCDQDPLFRGRADPIVEPGKLSQHSHKVFGGNNFGVGVANATPMEYFNNARSSSCTTCSISVDLSNYWIPDLYYQWPNGSFSLVPNGGLTVYYLSRSGTGNQSNPDFQPFPPGLRMTSGNPFRRSFDGSVANRAISYACLGGTTPETPFFPTNETECPDGLRAQVWFPMCWDGVNLDSTNHQSHMSFPLQAPDNGDCPDDHPVRVPGVFFEVLFDVNPANFPHGNGTNPFVWACGDSTGFGLHGDFLNGWDTDIVRKALKDPMCDLTLNANLDFGNNVKACPPLAPFVKDSSSGCALAKPIPTLEDLGLDHLIDHLPGCNPVTAGPASAIPCHDAPTPVSISPEIMRVLIQSAESLNYVTVKNLSIPLYASISPNGTLSYSEVFIVTPFGTGYSIISESIQQYITATVGGGDALIANRNSPSTWETFNITQNDDDTVTIVAQSNGEIVTLLADGSLRNNATSVTTLAQKFILVDANTLPQQTVPPQVLEDNPQIVHSSQPPTHTVSAVWVLGMLVGLLPLLSL